MPKKKASLALVPASARMPAASTVRDARDIPRAILDSIREFEQQIGGRQALIAALSTASGSEEVDAVLQVIADPRHDRSSLATVCAQYGITPGQLFGAFRTAAIVRGQILGSLKAAEVVPKVVDAIAKTALDHETPCTACNGVGTRQEPDPKGKLEVVRCIACNGVGQIRHPADQDQQRTILELTGLVKSGGSQQVNVQANIQAPVSASGGSLEQLQQAVSELIYQRPQTPSPIDAEVLPSPRDEPPG